MLEINDSLVIIPRRERSQPKLTDLERFINKFSPSKYKQLKNGIEVRSVGHLPDSMSKARSLIIDLSLGLEVVHTAEMASYKAFEIRIKE